MDEQRVNVPRTIQDPRFRYTRPVMRVKVEGRGKMIKTIIMNLREIAIDVYSTPEYILRFFGFELGASTQIDTKETNHPKYVIIGHRTVDELDNALDKFISNFVLCGTCKNPETVLSVKRGVLRFRCKACGFFTTPNPVHKLTKFIVNHPTVAMEAEDDEESQKKGKIGKKQEKDPDDEWSVTTTTEAVEKRKKELSGGSTVLAGDDENAEEAKPSGEPVTAITDLSLPPGGNPLELLSNFWKSNPPKPSIDEKVHKLQADQEWTDVQLFSVVFGSLFDQNLQHDFLRKAEIMTIFVKRPKDQKQLLVCIEKLCQMHPSLIPHLPSILQEFYNCCHLSEDVVFDWYEEPAKKIPKQLAKQIRDSCLPFITWLESAEVEDDEEVQESGATV